MSNAASSYFEDRADLRQLNELDWGAIAAREWRDCKERKQAEFLVERLFPRQLVRRIGVESHLVFGQVSMALRQAEHRSVLEVRPDWYYGR